jgi:hypothetical protein
LARLDIHKLRSALMYTKLTLQMQHTNSSTADPFV